MLCKNAVVPIQGTQLLDVEAGAGAVVSSARMRLRAQAFAPLPPRKNTVPSSVMDEITSRCRKGSCLLVTTTSRARPSLAIVPWFNSVITSLMIASPTLREAVEMSWPNCCASAICFGVGLPKSFRPSNWQSIASSIIARATPTVLPPKSRPRRRPNSICASVTNNRVLIEIRTGAPTTRNPVAGIAKNIDFRRVPLEQQPTRRVTALLRWVSPTHIKPLD